MAGRHGGAPSTFLGSIPIAGKERDVCRPQLPGHGYGLSLPRRRSLSRYCVAGERLGPAYGHVAQNAALLFDFDLRSEQLALIEDLRGGGDLVFSLHFLCEVSHDNDIQRGDDDVRYYLNKSTWIACMKQFGLDRIVLLEVDPLS